MTKTAQTKCVGNSVPPQLAKAVARAALMTIRYEPRIARPLLAALSAFCAELPQNSNAWTYHIRGLDDSLYLSRTILPRMLGARPLVHRIWREDADRHMHNHPWAWAKFLIVSGGYVEERLVGGRIVTRVLAPGDVNAIEASTFHRVRTVFPDTWTVGIVGERVQDWGFLVDGEVVPHKTWFARAGHEQTSEVS
jgi:hypothetical protein